jgi:TRAP-type mannitol/chloroaromatic compound transport system permease small subunit
MIEKLKSRRTIFIIMIVIFGLILVAVLPYLFLVYALPMAAYAQEGGNPTLSTLMYVISGVAFFGFAMVVIQGITNLVKLNKKIKAAVSEGQK